MLDNLIAFRILYLLVQPFNQTKAYKLGIIDEKGNVLRKSSTLKTPEEKGAFTLLHRLVFNLKKILAKLPGGETKIASIAAAYFLIKENYKNKNVSLEVLEEEFNRIISSNITLVEETHVVIDFVSLFEDAPANATGAAVSTDEPVIKPRKKNRFRQVDLSKAIMP